MVSTKRRRNGARVSVGMVGLLLGGLIVNARLALAAPIGQIEMFLVDENATGYATFQSHNQKVVSNQHGIFIAYIRTRNEPYTAQQWRLMRSTDGGETFSIVYEATHATNPATLETDEAGTIYLGRPDFQDGNAYLYRFSPKDDFAKPVITTIPGGAAGKYSMLYDARRKQLYWFSHNGQFFVIALDGKIRYKTRLIASGKDANLMYPLMAMGRSGRLHAGWTSQKRGVYLYWSIHHVVSDDVGRTWRNLDSVTGSAPLSLPIPADTSGPARLLTLDDEFDSHTWLSNMLVKDAKVHFLYMAQTTPPREHYIRLDEKTGKQDVRIQPKFAGKDISLMGLSGFFATEPSAKNSPLYCVSRFGSRIGCLISKDNGQTWKDFTMSEKITNIYAVGGARSLTPDGWLIGTFTDQVTSTASTTGGSRVHFFRIRTRRAG